MSRLARLSNPVVAVVTIIVGLGTSWYLGLEYCRTSQEAVTELLKEREANCAREKLALQDEVQDLKAERGALRAETLPDEPRVVRPLKERGYEVQLSVGNEAPLFGGQVVLRLLEASFADKPPRFRAVATLLLPNGSVAELDGVDQGFSINRDGYLLEVARVESSSAVFHVTQAPGTSR